MTNFDKSQHVSQLSHRHYYPNQANRELVHLSQDRCDLPMDLTSFLFNPTHAVFYEKYNINKPIYKIQR